MGLREGVGEDLEERLGKRFSEELRGLKSLGRGLRVSE